MGKRWQVIAAALAVLAFAAGFAQIASVRREAGLNSFIRLTKEDPLLYSPFLDPKAADAAIRAFRDLDQQIRDATILRIEAGGYGEDFEEYIPIIEEMRFMPSLFLEDLVQASSATKAFLEDPTRKRAEMLLAKYRKAAGSYRQDASRHLAVLRALENMEDRPLVLFQVDSITSSDVITGDLRTILKNADALLREISARKACLRGIRTCPAPAAPDGRTARFLELARASANPDLSQDEQENAAFIASMLRHSFEEAGGRSIDIRGPYRVESPCWESRDRGHWVYVYAAKREHGDVPYVKLATQNYYRRGKDGESSFVFQPEAASYQCMNNAVIPQALALDRLAGKGEPYTEEDRLFMENQFGTLPSILEAMRTRYSLLHLQQIQEPPLHPRHLFLTRSPYSLFYMPYARSVWRIDAQPQYFLSPAQANMLRPASAEIFTLDGLEREMGYTREAIQTFDVFPWETTPLIRP